MELKKWNFNIKHLIKKKEKIEMNKIESESAKTGKIKINSTSALLNLLTVEIDKLSKGKITASTASAMANMSGKIITIIRTEMEYGRLHGTVPYIPFITNHPKSKGGVDKATSASKPQDTGVTAGIPMAPRYTGTSIERTYNRPTKKNK